MSHNPPFLTAGSKPHAVTEFSNLSTEIFFFPLTNPLTNELLLHGWEGHGGMDRALDDAEINSLVHTIPSGAQRPLLWPVACLVLLLLPSRLTPGGFACNTLLTQARPVSSCWMRARTSLCVCVCVCLVSSSRENPNQPKETHHSGSCLYKNRRRGEQWEGGPGHTHQTQGGPNRRRHGHHCTPAGFVIQCVLRWRKNPRRH